MIKNNMIISLVFLLFVYSHNIISSESLSALSKAPYDNEQAYLEVSAEIGAETSDSLAYEINLNQIASKELNDASKFILDNITSILTGKTVVPARPQNSSDRLNRYYKEREDLLKPHSKKAPIKWIIQKKEEYKKLAQDEWKALQNLTSNNQLKIQTEALSNKHSYDHNYTRAEIEMKKLENGHYDQLTITLTSLNND